MAIENQKMENKVSRIATIDYATLEKQGRLPQAVTKRGSVYDPNPSPMQEVQGRMVSRGYATGPDEIWRVNYGPEAHYEMLELEQHLKEAGRDHKISVQLYPAEYKDYQRWLKEDKDAYLKHKLDHPDEYQADLTSIGSDIERALRAKKVRKTKKAD